jgi:predicted amidohydrolase
MRVAAIQTTAGPDRQANLDAAGVLVDEAAAAGATLVVLPEYFSVAGSPRHLQSQAEPLDGPTVTWASRLARRLEIHLLSGTFPERRDGPSDAALPSNTSCLIDPSGSVQAVYRKIHLFDVSIGTATVCESATITPGTDLCVTPLEERPGRAGTSPPMLGLSICYDLRFPEMYRILTLGGATVIAVPAAFTAATGPAHWELLLRARAVENQVFVIGADQVGELPPGMPPCHGHSMIVDPWGTVIAERAEPSPGVVVADLDWKRQQKIRSELPVLAHRRPEAYRWPREKRRGGTERGP